MWRSYSFNPDFEMLDCTDHSLCGITESHTDSALLGKCPCLVWTESLQDVDNRMIETENK